MAGIAKLVEVNFAASWIHRDAPEQDQDPRSLEFGESGEANRYLPYVIAERSGLGCVGSLRMCGPRGIELLFGEAILQWILRQTSWTVNRIQTPDRWGNPQKIEPP